jgi:hypothetical protein
MLEVSYNLNEEALFKILMYHCSRVVDAHMVGFSLIHHIIKKLCSRGFI